MTWMTTLQPLNEASRYTALWKPLLTCLDLHSHSLEWGLTLLCSGHWSPKIPRIWNMDGYETWWRIVRNFKAPGSYIVTNCRN